MYVRFRAFGRSLQASLAETRRVDRKPRSEQIGALGSVDNDLSPPARIISIGADRKDVVALMREMIARFEGQPEMTGRA